jgi:hypothetical protein
MRLPLALFMLAIGIGGVPLPATSAESDGLPFVRLAVESSTEKPGILTIDSEGFHLAARNVGLDVLLSELARNSGIEFDRPEDLKDHPVTVKADAADWGSIVRAALQGFNHVDRLNRKGAVEHVVITGLNGDGTAPDSTSDLGDDAGKGATPSTVSPDFAQLPRNAVRPIHLDRAKLAAMKLGEELPLSLPSGHYALVHDNRYTHENGDFTWVGYLKEDGQAFRAVMTFGKNGAVGQISTPEALYQIEPNNGRQWLIDIRAAGLSQSPQHGREPVPLGTAAPLTESDKPKGGVSAGTADKASEGLTANAKLDASAPTTIDLLVLYTPKVASGKATTRINQLLALANQAFVDSRVAISLRLTKAVRVEYPENGDNETALRDLTFARNAFGKVDSWRKESGADLVTLIRPFNHAAHQGCGTAWLNGADGSPLFSSHAFSVVNDGRSGSYYCSDYALAHELAHNMGCAHDRAHARVGGVLPYSFGYGTPGSFGTIMSYSHPRLGLFSNPKVSLCKGSPCGLDAESPAAADNALSLNAVRSIVAGFRPAVR